MRLPYIADEIERELRAYNATLALLRPAAIPAIANRPYYVAYEVLSQKKKDRLTDGRIVRFTPYQ